MQDLILEVDAFESMGEAKLLVLLGRCLSVSGRPPR